MQFAINPQDPESTGRIVGHPDLAFLAPSKRPDALGRLDHYEILEVRGRGGFGIVLKALDERLHRTVALKILPPQLAASALARKRFLREAQAAATIQNDNVVSIFAVEDGPCPYIVMEYVDGPSLQERIDKDGPLPLDEILRIGHQATCGLAAAHQQGLIHRDIKPGNILLENGVARVKITDFGLARAVDDASLTLSGVVHGTPAYMAPEQADGGPIDCRADLFSLGSVLYALATGQVPFQSSSSLAMLRSVLDESPTPMCKLRPELPQWFEDFVARLHAKKPDRRFQSAQEVADLLAQHLASVIVLGSKYVPAQRPRRIGRWVAVALGCVAIVVGGEYGLRAVFAPTAPPSAPTPERSLKKPPTASAPFNSMQARQHQDAWAEYLRVPVDYKNTIDMTLRLLPPGDFAVEGQDAHLVRLTKPFYLGTHEVTVAQFRAFVDATDYKTFAETDPKGGIIWNPQLRRTDQRPDINWRTPGFPQTEDHPVCCLTWRDATAFCIWLSERESKRYRLPTEAEWEYACRAGTTTPYSYGPVPDNDRMNVNLRGTMPVGSYSPNAFGMWDMHGNVYEWCVDGKRTYASGTAIDPRGPDDGPLRAVRGGCYSSGGPVLRSDYRGTAKVDHPYAGNGFRVVLEAP
jgi:serine/threonine protein kinase